MNIAMDQVNNWLNIVVCLLAFSCIYFSLKNPNERARYGQTAVVLGIFGTSTQTWYSTAQFYGVKELVKLYPEKFGSSLSKIKTIFRIA